MGRQTQQPNYLPQISLIIAELHAHLPNLHEIIIPSLFITVPFMGRQTTKPPLQSTTTVQLDSNFINIKIRLYIYNKNTTKQLLMLINIKFNIKITSSIW